MKNLFVGAFAAALVSVAGAGYSQGIALDSFDYANQAALDSAWTDTTVGVTLKTDGGHTGSNYVQAATSGGQKQRAINLTPTNANPVTLDFWIRVPNTNLGRHYMHLTNTGSTDVIQYGVNNGITTNAWLGRVNLGAPNGGTAFQAVGGTRVANTWTNLKLEVTTRDAKFYENGTLNATLTRTTSDFPALALCRIGSGLSSGIAIDFDDVKVFSAPAGVDDWNMY